MILIIGAGWYGCHIGKFLLKKKIPFVIYEEKSEIFTASSFYNQNRLHLGFHYPRSYKTRVLCKNGYSKFLSEYGFVVDSIENNAYYISKDSILDYETFRNIYTYEDINFTEEALTTEQNIQGNKILVDEKFIDPEKAKLYFTELLREHIIFNKKITCTELENLKGQFDLIFNCTLGKLGYSFDNEYIHEKTISLLYKQKSKKSESFTIMDGKFSSLYPQNIKEGIYTLTDVEYSPFISGNSPIQAYEIDVEHRKTLMEEKFLKYFPNFLENYTYHGYFISDKTKPTLNNDSRQLMIEKKDNVISFICGKITGLFEMEEYIKSLIKHDQIHSTLP